MAALEFVWLLLTQPMVLALGMGAMIGTLFVLLCWWGGIYD